jgi:hypothetical protein
LACQLNVGIPFLEFQKVIMKKNKNVYKCLHDFIIKRLYSIVIKNMDSGVRLIIYVNLDMLLNFSVAQFPHV